MLLRFPGFRLSAEQIPGRQIAVDQGYAVSRVHYIVLLQIKSVWMTKVLILIEFSLLATVSPCCLCRCANPRR